MEIIKSLFRAKANLSKISQPLSARNLLEKFDVFYVCFDEPNRKENWDRIKKEIPKATKVEGVLGFDNALKKCAKLSKTQHFFLIDGDNRLLPKRFDRTFQVEDLKNHYVLSWSSMNPVNGLAYGNGGLKLWPKNVALSINSHESAGADDDQTDYCFSAEYYLIDDYMTETIMNTTPTQAFRAGFREGVKMSLSWGKQVDLNFDNFEQSLGKQNRLRLKVWCEIGNDSLHGCWGILGARMGLQKNAIEKFDFININSYEWIDSFFEKEVLESLGLSIDDIQSFNWSRGVLKKYLAEIGKTLNDSLPLEIEEVTPIESQRFKEKFINPSRSGLLAPSPRP